MQEKKKILKRITEASEDLLENRTDLLLFPSNPRDLKEWQNTYVESYTGGRQTRA